jgi:septal ring factor EnvC (AmiA/AmiB activator)
MTATLRLISIASLTMILLAGCSQSPTPREQAQAERLRALEAKAARLEDDFRAAATARDQLRVSLARGEEQLQKLQAAAKERDELRVQLKARLAEREQLAAQYDQFRRSIRELVGQADGAVLTFPAGGDRLTKADAPSLD